MLLLQLDSQNASKDASQEKLEKGSVWDAKKIGQEILLPIIAFLCLFSPVCVCAAIDDAFCIFPDKNSALELLSNKCLFDVLLCPIFVVEKSSYCLLLRYNSGNK